MALKNERANQIAASSSQCCFKNAIAYLKMLNSVYTKEPEISVKDLRASERGMAALV